MNSSILESFIQAVAATPLLEWIAVATSIADLLLAAKEQLLCWFFALISVICYTILLIEANLVAETFLQVYYGAMAIYGFFNWKNRSSSAQIPISTLSLKANLFY